MYTKIVKTNQQFCRFKKQQSGNVTIHSQYPMVSLNPGASSSICLLMLSMPFISEDKAEERRSIWGRAKKARNSRSSRFPNEIAKTDPNLPLACVFILTKRVERQSDIIDGSFLLYLELDVLNPAVI